MAAVCETNLSCAVCLELYDDPRILPCGHSYCLKCLMGLTNKTPQKLLIICPICQAESRFKYGVHAFYTKNYELNSLTQLLILEQKNRDTTCEGCLCEICDPVTPAERACVECETMYCEKCFNACHPMKGKLRAHKIVNADETFKSKIDLKNDDRNVYCSNCDALIAVMDISKHKNHDVMSLKEAHSLFKVKLDEATGNIDLMQSTLDECLEKSKAKLNEVETMFEAIELSVKRRKDEVLNKLRADVKAAESAIDNLAPAMSTYRELQERNDTISFIEESQITLRRSSLKSDFNEVHRMFERINALKCASESVIHEITNLELRDIPESDGPKITKLSNVIKERKNNKVVLEWTSIPDAESYCIFSKVTSPGLSTNETSCVLDNIDGTETTELWVTAKVNGRVSLPSASVKVPTVTLPNLLFDHQRAGAVVRVSRDGRKTTLAYCRDYPVYAAQSLGDYYPQAENALRHNYTVLGNSHMTAGRLYWEIEAYELARRKPYMSHKYIFGVTSPVTDEYRDPGRGDSSWAVELRCNYETTTINMMHADECLHEEDCGFIDKRKSCTHRYGLLLDIDNRSMSVIDVKKSSRLFTFTNVDTSRGVFPIFAIDECHTLRLLSPDEIQQSPLLSLSAVGV